MVEPAATEPGTEPPATAVAAEPAEAEEDVGKEAESHELELARASLPTRLELERSWAKAGVESREFSEPDKIPAEPAVPGLSPCCCCCWLLAAAMVPSKVVMKAAFPAASPEVPRGSAAAGLGVVTGLLELFRSAVFHLLELLLLTTHFLMCFSRVEATLKGMLQNRHL